MTSIAKSIKIVKRPHGTAQEWVRDAWIGCILPCDPECGHIPVASRDVHDTEDAGPIVGFSVPQDEALDILRLQSPEAAKWFCKLGFPRGNERFRFKADEVVVVEYVPDKDMGNLIVFDDMERGTMKPVRMRTV